MSDKPWLRKRLLVEFRIQGALVVRVVLYWMMCLFTIAVVLLLWRLMSMAPRPLNFHLRELWSNFGAAAVATVFLLPLVIFDVLRITNRIVGPIYRLRRAMSELAEGKPVGKIQFREGDFWHDFAHDFNTVAGRQIAERREDRGPSSCDREDHVLFDAISCRS